VPYETFLEYRVRRLFRSPIAYSPQLPETVTTPTIDPGPTAVAAAVLRSSDV